MQRGLSNLTQDSITYPWYGMLPYEIDPAGGRDRKKLTDREGDNALHTLDVPPESLPVALPLLMFLIQSLTQIAACSMVWSVVGSVGFGCCVCSGLF